MLVRHVASVVAVSLGFGLGLGLLPGCGTSTSSGSGTSEATTSQSSAIQGGTADTTHKYAVGIFGQASGGLCSGALIAPNLVVTARHCVAKVSSEQVNCATDKFGSVYAASSFVITTDDTLSQNGKFFTASKVIVPTGTTFCGSDIALIILAKNVPATTATPITPGIQFPLTDRAHYTLSMTAIGYGITAVGAQDEGVRRIKQNIPIQCIPGDKKIDCTKLGAGSAVAASEFVAGSGTCSGDSGSSAYEQTSFDKGVPVSMGVLSRGGEQGTQCIDSVYTRLDSFADLIRGTAQEAATAGGYPLPAWAAIVDPGTEPDAGTPTPPPAAGTPGAACASNDDCESKSCASVGSDSPVCVTPCNPNDKTTCSEGFTCHADGDTGLCFPTTDADKTTPTNATTTTATSGCSSTGGRGPTSPVPWIVGLAVGVTAAIRRRRSRAPSAGR